MSAPSVTADVVLSGRYRVLSELGRGGMGAVYRALDQATGQVVALKTLEHPSPALITPFEREYHTLASIAHPCVIEVYDFGVTADGRRYYTMELLAGSDLLELAPLPYAQVCTHVRDVATSLALLHARKLVHRDVSPRNVRLDSRGRAKLLDFGALAPFGVASEVVGTLLCMAPETLHGLPLDQRTDLFSLGVVCYFALTNCAPFAIRRLGHVDSAQRVAPVPPSEHVAGIPAALDRLVLSLLSVDPMERPSSAAEVIDRLSAIANLDAQPLLHLAESHLLSSALVGRERERAQLRQQLDRSLRGAGGLAIVEASAGMGRTRLMRELGIDARIAGATVLSTSALAHSEPHGTLRALGRALLQAAPSEAAAALVHYVGVLGQAFGELRQHAQPAPDSEITRLPSAPAERRERVQRAFAQWVLAVAQHRPLLIMLDDAHLVDLESAGAFVLLAHAAVRAQLLLVLTLQRDAATPVVMWQLARFGSRTVLGALNAQEFDQLMASVFGEVPHRTRLLQWLIGASRGNPGQAFALLRHLVERDLIRYAGSTWVLPAELPEHELPKDLAHAQVARIATLDATALRLGRSLAVHRGALSMLGCLQLVPGLPEATVLASLATLTGAEFIVPTDDGYRFAQESSRALFVSGLADEELRPLVLALAQALMATQHDIFSALTERPPRPLATPELLTVLEVAFLLMRCGEPRGWHMLRDAAIELTMRGDGLAEAVPTLEAAVKLCQAAGRPLREYGMLLVTLTLAGTYNDPRLCRRYGDQALDTFLRASGLAFASRLRRFVGGHVALFVGLSFAFVRFLCAGQRRAVRSFREVMQAVMGVSSALLGTQSVLLDAEQAQQVARRIDILRFLPKQHLVGLAHKLQLALFESAQQRSDKSWTYASAVLAALSDEHALPGEREEIKRQLQVGCLTPMSLGSAMRIDGRAELTFAALAGLQMAVSRQLLAGARATWHAHRGERAQFLAYREEVDKLAGQAGSTWRVDVGMPRQLWSTYALCEDVLALKRCIHELDAFAEDAPAMARMRDAAHALYLSERGMHRAALAQYEGMFERAIEERSVTGARHAGAYARILRLSGAPQRAREIVARALSQLAPPLMEYTLHVFGAQLEGVLSTAALGEFDEALALLDRIVAAQGKHDNPLLHGLVYKTRAVIALSQGKREAFSEHFGAMQDWFRRTDNPALIAQCQRLGKEARAFGISTAGATPDDASSAEASDENERISIAFRACGDAPQRLQVALDLILERTQAERGYLYLLRPEGLVFVAPGAGSAPPPSVLSELITHIERVRSNAAPAQDDALDTVVTAVETTSTSRLNDNLPVQVPLVLAFSPCDELIVVGAVALLASEGGIVSIPRAFSEAIARALHESDEVRSVYLGETEHHFDADALGAQEAPSRKQGTFEA